jgi:hypothetical protein
MRDNTAASRKFIDLIRQASSKWANWDPPIEIKVSLNVLVITAHILSHSRGS